MKTTRKKIILDLKLSLYLIFYLILSLCLVLLLLVLLFYLFPLAGAKVQFSFKYTKFLCIFNIKIKDCKDIEFLTKYHYYLEYYYYLCHQ